MLIRHCFGVFIVIAAYSTGVAEQVEPGISVFAMTFMDLDIGSTDNGFYQILISAINDTSIRVKIPFVGETRYRTLSRRDNDYFNFTTNSVDYAQAPNMNIVENKGVIVVTRGSNSVNAAHTKQGSGEAYLPLALTRESKEYYIPAYPSIPTGRSLIGIAAAGETCVELYRFVAGEYKLIEKLILQNGDVFQKYGGLANSGCGNVLAEDFTGMYIVASQGVTVLAGHECAQIPCGTQFCDLIMEAIPPVHAWGSTVVVPGVAGRNILAGYMLRIVVSASTVITVTHNANLVSVSAQHGCNCTGSGSPTGTFDTCTQNCSIQQGEFLELYVSSASAPIIIRCMPPCLVTQYTYSRNKVSSESDDPDPYMMVITPTESYVNNMSYVTPAYLEPLSTLLKDYAHYLVMVVRTTDRAGLRLDEAAVTGAIEQTIGDYTVLTKINMLHGQHSIRHINPAVNVMAFASGSSPPANAALNRASARTSYALPCAYFIPGDAILGNWTLELDPLPGEETTAAPRQCSQFTEDSVHQLFTLEVGDISSCALTAAEVQTFRAAVNDAICQWQICPGVPSSVYIETMTSYSDTSKLFLDIMLTTTMDTVITTLMRCKRDVIAFVTHAPHWSGALSTSKMLTCQDKIENLELSQTEFSCGIRTG